MGDQDLVPAQFETIRGLIKSDRAAELRLAFILLDSVVELLMHRMIQVIFSLRRHDYRKLESWKAMLARDDAWERYPGLNREQYRQAVNDLEAELVSKTKRTKIDREFGAKVTFLVEQEWLPAGLELVLQKLHYFRNDTYHRDKHRIEVVRPAALIYFDVACSVFEAYGCSSTDVQQMRDDIGLGFETVRAALAEHLLERLEDLRQSLDHIDGCLTSHDAQPGDAILVLQIEDGDVEAIFDQEVLRSRAFPIGYGDLDSWTARAHALKSETDRYALFIEFGSIEECFEKLEEAAQEMIFEIDDQANNFR